MQCNEEMEACDSHEAWPNNQQELLSSPSQGSADSSDHEVHQDDGESWLAQQRRKRKTNLRTVAAKEPILDCEGDEGEDLLALESPDLAEYFDQFEGISEISQIAICRTYANYLAARQKRAPSRMKRQRK